VWSISPVFFCWQREVPRFIWANDPAQLIVTRKRPRRRLVEMQDFPKYRTRLNIALRGCKAVTEASPLRP
jgi:hypothetical protein